MRRSKTHLFFHLVWATDHRKQVLLDSIERDVHRCIYRQAEELGCVVLALNGMPDHVHLVVQAPATVVVAELAKQVKGVSSAMVNDKLRVEERFRWQENYAAFSLSRSHLDRVIRYVQNQEEHHTRNKIWREWEETDEATEG